MAFNLPLANTAPNAYNAGGGAQFADPTQPTFGTGLVQGIINKIVPQAYAEGLGSTPSTYAPGYAPGQVQGASTSANVPLTGKYTGWDQTAANADALATGGFNNQSQISAAQQAYNAQNSALNTQFDKAAADLNAQLPFLQQQRDSALSSLDTQWQQAQDQTKTARTNAQTNTEDQINQAGDVAHQTQNQNRNILRALGIGGGTYAAELLSKPLNIYDQQRGQLNTALGQRMSQLDDYLNTVQTQHAQAVGDLQNNYANLVGKIQSDLRFNDRQRNDALAAANAALQTNLANIQSSAQQYAQQVQLMKMQLAQSAGTFTNYTNPTYNNQAFQNTLLTNPGNSQFTTGNLQALVPQKKDLTLNGFNSPVANQSATLSGLGL